MSEEDIYTAPKSDLGNELTDGSKCEFFPTSQRKLVVLFIVTFGAYPVYWFYKNWALYKKNAEKKIMPLLRAIFYIFFTHSLFRIVEVIVSMTKRVANELAPHDIEISFLLAASSTLRNNEWVKNM